MELNLTKCFIARLEKHVLGKQASWKQTMRVIGKIIIQLQFLGQGAILQKRIAQLNEIIGANKEIGENSAKVNNK